MDLIILDLQPLSVVENIGFRKLMNAMDPRYVTVSRKQLSEVLLPARYEEGKASLREELKDISTVSITTDPWTSCTNEGYTTITVHYIKGHG